MFKISHLQKGLTLVELIIVVGLIAVFSTSIGITLFATRQKTSLQTNLSTFITDVKQQQIKAMVGDTDGNSTTSAYGIYFQTDQYTLFNGSTYSSSDPSNFVVALNSGSFFNSISFPSSTIVFSKGSGEITGFVDGSDTVVLKNTIVGDQKTIRFNRYGVISSLQ